MEIGCWAKWNQLLSEVDSEAGDAIRKLCVGRRLKMFWWIALLNHVGTHLDGKIVN